MRAVEEDRDWWTKNVTDGQPNEKYSARELLCKIADSTWHCGDPGMQYDTTVNRWHTCKNTRGLMPAIPAASTCPGRHGVQPGFAESDEVQGGERAV